MITTILRVRGRELPKPWAERVGVTLDESVQVTLETLSEPENKTLKAKLEEGLEQVKREETCGPFDSADELFKNLDNENEN